MTLLYCGLCHGTFNEYTDLVNHMKNKHADSGPTYFYEQMNLPKSTLADKLWEQILATHDKRKSRGGKHGDTHRFYQ
jgi:hypothetical protein